MAWSGYSESGRGSQERGPGSFSLQLPGGVVRMAPRPQAEASEVRVGVSGGEVRDTSRSYADYRAPQQQRITQQAQLPEVVVQKDPTAELLGKIANARFAEKIKEAQQEAFVKGAARAASGEAMAEIASTQPWYQSIFGDTAVVEGARAYTIKAGVAKWTGEQINNMEQLAQQSPDAVPAYLSKSMQQYMTGDAATDQAMQAELLSQVPSLVKEHTKQHYMLQQKRADEAHTGAIANSLNLFEQYANGTLEVEPDGAANIMAGIEQALALQPGMNPEAHYARVSKVITQAAQAGNFKTLGALAGMGYIDKLTIEDQQGIDKALRSAAPMKLSQAAMALEGEMLSLFRNPPLTAADRAAAVDELNSRAADLSGVPPEYGRLLDLPDRLRLAAAGDSLADQAANAAAKAQAKAQKEWVARAAVASNDPNILEQAKVVGGLTQADLQAEYSRQLAGLSVEEQAERVARAPFPIDSIQAAVKAERSEIMLSDNPDPVIVDAAVKRYRTLTDKGAPKGYYDDDYALFLDNLSRVEYKGENTEAAIRLTRTKVRQTARYSKRPDKEILSAVDGYLDDEFQKGFVGRTWETISGVFGAPQQLGANVNARTRSHIAAVVGGAVASGYDTGNPERAAADEMRGLVNRGEFTPVGRNVIINERPDEARRDNQSLATLLDMDPVRANTIADIHIAETVTKQGIDPNDYIVLRMAGPTGEFVIFGRDLQGREAVATFSAADLKLKNQQFETAVEQQRATAAQAQARMAQEAADIAARPGYPSSPGNDLFQIGK